MILNHFFSFLIHSISVRMAGKSSIFLSMSSILLSYPRMRRIIRKLITNRQLKIKPTRQIISLNIICSTFYTPFTRFKHINDRQMILYYMSAARLYYLIFYMIFLCLPAVVLPEFFFDLPV